MNLHEVADPEETGRNDPREVDEYLLGVSEDLEGGEAVDVCKGFEVIGGGDHDEANEAVAELEDGDYIG